MKILRSGLFAIVAAVGLSPGQSLLLAQQVDLMNLDSYLNYDTNATSFGLIWTNGPDGPGVLQEDVSVTLLGGTNAANLTELVTLTVADGSAYGDMSFFAVGVLLDPWGWNYTVPGVSVNGTAVLQLRLWLGNSTNYDDAVAAGASVADSGPFYNPTGGGGTPASVPADLMGMPAMILSASQSDQGETGGFFSGGMSGGVQSSKAVNIYSNLLWLDITPTTTNRVIVTLNNPMVGYYQLWNITNVISTNWVLGATVTNLSGSTQTNFPPVSTTNYSAMFFRADTTNNTNIVTVANALDAIRPSTNGATDFQVGRFDVSMVAGTLPVGSGLDVFYRVSGLASNGVDYENILTNGIGKVTVVNDPTDGLTPGRIYIHPYYTNAVNFSEQVTVTLMPSSGYLADPTNASATLDIYDYFSMTDTNVFTPVATLNNPQGIDYDPYTNSLIAAVNDPSGSPFNFEQISTNNSNGNTITNQWSIAQNLGSEINLAVVPEVNANGFTYGTMYYPQASGVIGRMSVDGQLVTNTWVTLTGETLVNGLCFDRSGNFGGDLIAVTSGSITIPGTNGSVWRIAANGTKTKLASLPPFLEGVITLTNDAAAIARFGPWAGKIITGSKQQHKIYTIDTTGTVTAYPLGIEAEDFDLIPTNQNLYCLDPYYHLSQSLLKVSSTLLTNVVGDLLITQAGDISANPGMLFIVRWDASSLTFSLRKIAHHSFEAVTFAPIDIKPLGP